MADYRCYVLNKEDRVSSRHDIEADSDADAIIRAGLMAPYSDDFPAVEVWCGERRVGRVPRPSDGAGVTSLWPSGVRSTTALK